MSDPRDSGSGAVLVEHGRTLIPRVRDLRKSWGRCFRVEGDPTDLTPGRGPQSSQGRSPAVIAERHRFFKKSSHHSHCYKAFNPSQPSPHLGKSSVQFLVPGNKAEASRGWVIGLTPP